MQDKSPNYRAVIIQYLCAGVDWMVTSLPAFSLPHLQQPANDCVAVDSS